ncbi:MAG: L,D-transpeptidase [Bradyrhizobiaceae bacterium PARB1]|jgi:lipoprotein-anchoring transpeptidase ErfK/SrfK|nr:MAG: L,D-transpeptidase [Bradyrhizobiaceae bacterium PARB1]
MKRILAVLSVATALVAVALPAEARNRVQPAEPDFVVDDGPSLSNFFSNFGNGNSSGPIPRQTVGFQSNYAPGTIVVNTAERRLYLVQPGGTALRYGIGVGRDGFRWGGVHKVTAKKEWPSWTPPAQMLARRPDLPRYMPGGIDNPLGARAMYLGSTLYRIHGSNEPETIGQAVSSGCFRMTNEDVTDLYNRVRVGATVIVKN